ncbi:membrane protein insertion efficiency factor YidD [bacterium]|nr:membrane protein insertion efficiency factor YidD [bacterium]
MPVAEPEPAKDWTVLLYQEGEADQSLREMAHTVEAERVQVVVQQSKQTLSEFLSWGMEEFPARRYAVIVQSPVALSAVSLQESLQQAHQRTGKDVDLLALDSSAMQQSEVAYQLREQASVLVASQGKTTAEVFPYAEALAVLKSNPKMSPQQLGSQLVQQQAKKSRVTVQTAVDLAAQRALGEAVRTAVHTMIEEKVPADLIYTSMMRVRAIEADDPSKDAFDLRDLSAFLSNLSGDPRLTSERAREALENALKAQQETLLAHHSGGNHTLWGNARGASVYMPWQAPTSETRLEYQALDWDRDTGWDNLLDYIFKSTPSHQPHPATGSDSRSLGQKVGGVALRAYKKYVSGYLGVACSYTPSCSQYTRQAIMHHGLWEGSKYGAMRWISCDGSHHGHYPVPGAPESHSAPNPEQVSLLSVPTSRASTTRRKLTHLAAHCAQRAGQVVGALAGALVGAPLGLAIGALVGHKVGNGTIDAWNQNLFEKYQPHCSGKILELESKLASSAHTLRNALLEKTGSESWSGRLAGTYGAISGGVLGAVGGALALGRMGSRFAGLAASNGTRDLLGQFPKDPHTQDLLNKEFT